MQWDRGFSMPRLIAAFRTEHPRVEIRVAPRLFVTSRACHPSISV
jgi:hypothetical protein